MKITSITASYKRTINLGNYENVAIESSLTADLEEGDDYQLALKQLFDTAKAEAKNNLPQRALQAITAKPSN